MKERDRVREDSCTQPESVSSSWSLIDPWWRERHTADVFALTITRLSAHCCAQIMHPNDDIAHVDDTYWRLRAEFVPEDEIELREGERLLHCYHMSRVRLFTTMCVFACQCQVKGNEVVALCLKLCLSTRPSFHNSIYSQKMLTKSAGGSTVMQPASAVEQQQQQQLPQEAGNEQGQAPQLVRKRAVLPAAFASACTPACPLALLQMLASKQRQCLPRSLRPLLSALCRS